MAANLALTSGSPNISLSLPGVATKILGSPVFNLFKLLARAVPPKAV